MDVFIDAPPSPAASHEGAGPTTSTASREQ
jgi:hypothetical protein